jgi:hypothetical protein
MLALITLIADCAVAQTQSPQPDSSPRQKHEARGSSTIRGRAVYSDTARPLRRAEVTLISEDDGSWVGHSVTKRNGEFVLANVSAGKYIVVVSAPDIVSPINQFDRNSSLAEKIALRQIEDGFAEVTVDGRSSAKTEIRAIRCGVITGRVLTEDEVPIAKAEIKLFQSQDGKLLPVTFTWQVLDADKRMFETDSRGIYRIAGLGAGEYIVRASESNLEGTVNDDAAGGYADGSMMVAYYPKALRIHDATKVRVELGIETKDVDIRIPDRSGHRLSGTVVVAGHAALGAEIRLNRAEPAGLQSSFNSVKARTDANGKWEIRAVPDGIYTLSVSGYVIGLVQIDVARGHVSVAPERRQVIVSGSDVTDLNVELVEGGEVSGVVSVEGNARLPDRLFVGLVPMAPTSRAQALEPAGGPGDQFFAGESADGDAALLGLIREQGKFSITQLQSGLFQFRLEGLGRNVYVKAITLNGKDLLRNPVKIEAGKETRGVQIVLATDVVKLSGRAVEKSGGNKALTDAAVLLLPVDAGRRRAMPEALTSRTDKEGRFVIKGAPGEYFVFVFDRRRKGKLIRPAEETLAKQSARLQKIRLQRGDENRIVEVVGTE